MAAVRLGLYALNLLQWSFSTDTLRFQDVRVQNSKGLQDRGAQPFSRYLLSSIHELIESQGDQ
ncbi:hypothetical protein DPH57_18585 [Massilia sp. YMA4]|nr:hypothetical protein DPH57_18585 [Massilia sp. YMA4]